MGKAAAQPFVNALYDLEWLAQVVPCHSEEGCLKVASALELQCVVAGRHRHKVMYPAHGCLSRSLDRLAALRLLTPLSSRPAELAIVPWHACLIWRFRFSLPFCSCSHGGGAVRGAFMLPRPAGGLNRSTAAHRT